MDKVNEKIGTDYKLFNYYGSADAEHVIIAMGSVNDTIEAFPISVEKAFTKN